MDCLNKVPFQNVEITGGFWAEKQKLNRDVTIFSVLDRFEDTGRFCAFQCSWKEDCGKPKPHYFWDSDVAKWMESAAYILQKHPVPALEEKIEEVISLIEKNQCEDGYFNIYHMVVEPENRFRIRDHHELYCLGHLIEAAVAYYEATGRDRLINILDRYIDLVIRVFTVERSAGFVTPGHEEIELALIKLYRLRKDRKYLDLAMFFLDERGKKEENDIGWCRSSYNQSHLPVRQQKTAEGHSVRACYLYSAMADAAKETGDAELLEACKALFDDIAGRKMYITGGVGSSNKGEAFTIAYDLPNDTAYAETCASIALAMFADRMKEIDIDGKYADVVEREMYNGVIAGLSLDGRSFFYENPLEINLSDHHRHTSVNDFDRLPITQRVEVFDCSCCPPNVTRFIASIGGSAYSFTENTIFIHQFFASKAEFDGIRVEVETGYPVNGKVKIRISGGNGRKLAVRIPGWCRKKCISKPFAEQKGYAYIVVDSDSFEVEADFEMSVEFYASHPSVRANSGKVAVGCGPIIYCAEAVDNGKDIHDIAVDTESRAEVAFDEHIGVNVITLCGFRSHDRCENRLFYPADQTEEAPVKLKLIPYYAYANRGETDMTVWLKKH